MKDKCNCENETSKDLKIKGNWKFLLVATPRNLQYSLMWYDYRSGKRDV